MTKTTATCAQCRVEFVICAGEGWVTFSPCGNYICCSEECRDAMEVREAVGREPRCRQCAQPVWTRTEPGGWIRAPAFCSVTCETAWEGALP